VNEARARSNMTKTTSRTLTRGAAATLAATALATLGGCSGCKRQPALRLTYEVDTAHAYDGETDAAKVMGTTRDVIAHRLERSATVTTSGQDLIVELVALKADELRAVKSIIVETGRLEFKMVDDAGSDKVFGAIDEDTLPDGEALAVYREAAPDGLDRSGNKKHVDGSYARIACQVPKYPTESAAACLDRLRAWATTLHVPGDHVIGFQSVTEPVPDTEPLQFKEVGWRTLLLFRRAEVTGESITDVAIGQDQQNFGQYYVSLTFSPAGAEHFAEVTGANVNRRFAIILDDRVDSAPVIRSQITGGHAQITMGAGDPEKQLRDAKQLDLVLLSGALPAPLHLVSEVTLLKAR